jgi:excisionase family DNA binding protein
MEDLSEYMTTREAAEALGVTKARVDQLCKAGRLKFVMKGNSRLLQRADVEAFAKLDRPSGRPGKKTEAGSKPRREGK